MARLFGNKRRVGCQERHLHYSGMTLLEVLIAVLLFAVFSGTFLMVTEMIGQLFPADRVPGAENSCNGPALEEACINTAFDKIVPELEEFLYPGLNVDAVVDADQLNQIASTRINEFGLLPDAYEVAVYQWERFTPQQANQNMPAKPGLYLLQAKPRPESSAFWRKPIQRLFCRPYHRCLSPS